MKAIIWRIVAWLVSREPIASWIIHIAKRTPYQHIYARHDPSSIYMRRYWLFNPYRKDDEGTQLPARWPWLPSVRVHHILRADDDLHLHSHPWDARTIILRGSYVEEMEECGADGWLPGYIGPRVETVDYGNHFVFFSQFLRRHGYTGTLDPNSFHRIAKVDGVVTLFFTWGTSRGWGFKVGDRVVPYKEYLK